MKKLLFAACLCTIMIFSVSTGWSAPIDSILGYESLPIASEAAELTFVNTVLADLGMGMAGLYNGTGAKVTFGGNDKEIVYDPGFAWDYAVVKVDGHNDFSYVFWDNQAGGGDNILTTPLHGTNPFNMGNPPRGYGISHITWFVGTTQVPEPSTILLLVTGLAGVGLLRRRFKS